MTTSTAVPIYLDFNATTPIDPRVRDVMVRWLTEDACGNPSSPYAIGRKAKDAIERARDQVAAAIGSRKWKAGERPQVIFTSGATESSNWAIKGAALSALDRLQASGETDTSPLEVVTVTTEHVATLKTCEYLETRGFKVTYVPVSRYGVIDLNALKTALTDRTVVVSVMYVNNETGTIQPVSAVSKLVRRHAKRALLHCDASQAIGRLNVEVEKLGVDLLTVAGHKFHAPKGVGALYIRRGTPPLHPLLHGGGQEYGLRPGTENTLLCVALGAAAEIASKERASFAARAIDLRQRLFDGLKRECGATSIVPTVLGVDGVDVLCNTLHVCFVEGNVTGADLIREFGERLLASGQSACKTGSSLSHVLKAMGLPTTTIQGALRLSLGRTTTRADIDRAVQIIGASYNKLSKQNEGASKCASKGEVECSKKQANVPAVPLVTTKPLYFEDSHRTFDDGTGKTLAVFELCTETHGIKTSETARHVVTLDATIFHPQGGGQPSDVGTLTYDGVVFHVSKVVASPMPAERAAGVVWHIGAFDSASVQCERCIGECPKQTVDRSHRLLCARLHSAGHLLDVAMQQCDVKLRPGKGYHFTKGSYVEYVGKIDAKTKETLLARVQKVCTELIKANVKTSVHYVDAKDVAKLCHDDACDTSHFPSDRKVRVVCVGDTKGCPCGGTHVKSTGEIRDMTVTKIKTKKGNTRVSYKLS